jgi:glutamine phosphoribosylpyrophosphate amidotransferase
MQKRFQHVGEGLIIEDGNIFNSNELIKNIEKTKLNISDNIDSELNNQYNNEQMQFFSYYYTDYLDFVRDIQEKGLLRKRQINRMINEHSCDSYSSNIVKLIKSQF